MFPNIKGIMGRINKSNKENSIRYENKKSLLNSILYSVDIYFSEGGTSKEFHYEPKFYYYHGFQPKSWCAYAYAKQSNTVQCARLALPFRFAKINL